MGTSAIPASVDVAPMDAFGAADGAAVGGKAANLGELLRAVLPPLRRSILEIGGRPATRS